MENGKWDYIDKIIGFVYANFMKLKTTEKVKRPVFSATFIDNVKDLTYNKTNIHHLHITGDIIDIYCNLKVRENRDKISVIAYNLFRFDLLFFIKRMRAGSWRTRDISIGGRNPTDINFANIGNLIAFIDAIKNFQPRLAFLAKRMTGEEKKTIKIGCKKFILNDPKLARKFNECTES